MAFTVNYKVKSSADDAHEPAEGGGYSHVSATVNFVSALSSEDVYITGLRFRTVGIPQGAIINDARLRLYVVSTLQDDVDVTLFCEDADSAVQFSSSDAPNDRTRTSASSEWQDTGLIDGGSAAYKLSADFSSSVQEVIDRSGWEEGNSLAVIAEGNVGTQRTLVANSVDNATSGTEPQIRITFSVPTTTVPVPTEPSLIMQSFNNTAILQRVTRSRDDFFSVLEEWTTYAKVQCRVRQLSGGERRLYGKDTSEVTHRMYCSPIDLTPADRVQIGDEIYDVARVNNPHRLHEFLQVDMVFRERVEVPTSVGALAASAGETAGELP